MPELQRLNAGHAAAVLAFELENRSYFAAFISDRGDEFFDQFAEQHRALLAGQEAGAGAYYVLADGDGSVLGRFNLRFAGDGTAELGYRVARYVADRGAATAAVRELCELAARHGLRTLRAAVSCENVASQKVLAKAGFTPGRPGLPRRQAGHLVPAQPVRRRPAWLSPPVMRVGAAFPQVAHVTAAVTTLQAPEKPRSQAR